MSPVCRQCVACMSCAVGGCGKGTFLESWYSNGVSAFVSTSALGQCLAVLVQDVGHVRAVILARHHYQRVSPSVSFESCHAV